MTTTQTESVIETGFTSGLWSQILPGFFQGGTNSRDTVATARNPYAAAEITPAHFDLVVTAYAHARPVDWHVTELRVGFYDADIENIPMDQLRLAVVTAHEAWKSGKRVLSRCAAGLNRSGIITALVLIREGFTASEAIEMIRDRRSPSALFNQEFVNWLLDLDVAEWRA